MSEEDTMKKPMATKNAQVRYEQNIKELRDGEASFFITIGLVMTSIVIMGQLLAHVLTG